MKRKKVRGSENNALKKRYYSDTTLIFAVLFLIVFGIIMIYSSSYYASYERYGNHIEFLKKQVIWSLIGVFCMFFVSRINYKFITQMWLLIYGSSIVFLVLVLFIGDEINGAKRWLDFGIIGFQPSEFAKLAIIITMAVALSSTQKHLNYFRVFLINMLIVIIPTALIGIENMSTAFVAFAIGTAMVFVSLPNMKTITKFLIIPAIISGGLLIFVNSIFKYVLFFV